TTATPDIVVEALSFEPTNPDPGGAVSVSFTIANRGQGPASPFSSVLRISDSSTSSAGPNLVTINASSMPANSSFSGTTSIPSPTTNGIYYVWMVADNSQTAGQTPANEENDIVLASGTLVVDSPFAWGSADPTFPTTTEPATSCELPTGASPQDYVMRNEFKVYAGNCIASLTLPSEEWSSVVAGAGSFNAYEYSRNFSNAFLDSFDFIVYVLDVDEPDEALTDDSGTLLGQYFSLQNRLPTRTRRLLGYTVLTFIGSPDGRPNPIRGGPILHELMHEWGNNGVIPVFEGTTQDIGSHWMFSSVGGQLGGYYGPTGVQSIGPGEWQAKGPPRTCLETANQDEAIEFCSPRDNWRANVWLDFSDFRSNSIEYSPLEVYIAGFSAFESLPSVTYAEDADWISQLNGTFTASSLVTLSPSEIRDRLGIREPDFATSQKNFRMAVVVLTPNEVVSEERLQDLNFTLTEFNRDDVPQWGSPNPNVIWLHNFYTATRGLARMRSGNLTEKAR
ncbi:MAG: hypothetical protein HKN13_03465, partial [Rhodothermales bacterium]|nr:hypothetical protein [Rhodothermales bacterium]